MLMFDGRSLLSRQSFPALRATFLGWLVVAGAGLSLRSQGSRVTSTAIVESLFHLAVLLFLARQDALRDLLAELPRPRRWLLIGLFGLLLIGQLGGRNRLTFPFVQWGMYTNSFAGNRYLDYTATREDGVEIRFPIVEVYPTAGRHIVWKVAPLMAVGMRGNAGPSRDDALAQVDALLLAYGRRYNNARPTAPVKGIHVWECAIPIDDYRGPSSITRRRVRSVEIPPGSGSHAP
jgi:hypothetical protein